MQKLLLLIIFISIFFASFAQQKYTISGTIKAAGSGELIASASVQFVKMEDGGTASNDYGFYSISSDHRDVLLKISHVGFQPIIVKIRLIKDTLVNFALYAEIQDLQENAVTVHSAKENNVSSAQMGIQHISLSEAAKIPVIFGERDILKTIQLLPGVKSAGDGNAGFFVRGSSAGQNLILLDEAPVYNASHLFGFFSTFNSDAIKEAQLIKGNEPAQYGGRLASVLDVKMKEGNNQTYHVAGGVGIISSRLSFEGPIQKNKSSFLITGRRTYADLFMKLSKNKDLKDNELYFYDINTKANFQINRRNHLYLSGYFGQDKLGIDKQFGINWGNKTGTLRWNSLLNPHLFSNTTFTFSNYDFNILLTSGKSVFHINSSIKDINLKQEFDWYIGKGIWHLGMNSIYHQLSPTRFIGGNDTADYTQKKQTRNGWENAIYLTHNSPLSDHFNIEYGLRLSSYSLVGGGLYNLYKNDALYDSVYLSNGTIGKTYLNLEPRLSMSFMLTPNKSLKAAYARNTQNLHLLSNSVSTNPTDQWMGDSYNIKPEIADQVSLGFYNRILNNQYELSVETYYKWMQNQIDYKNGADLTTTEDVESQLLFGNGRAYGIEFYLKKKLGKLTGWLSYTLSRTERKIDGINNDKWYLARQDRKHDLALVAMYQLSRKWDISGDFIFYTGNAVTFPKAKYQLGTAIVYYYTERNGYRMPNYDRLDLSATLHCRPHKNYSASWSFGIYNAYGRENAYAIRFRDDPDNPLKTQAVQTALFRWVPSVTYNFKF